MEINLWLILEIIFVFGLLFIMFNFAKNFEIVFIKKGSLETTENITLDDVRNYVSCYAGEEDAYCTFPVEDYRLFYTAGKSMQPYLVGKGEMLLCNNNFTLEEGNLYAYFDETISDVSIVHRCIEKTETGCLFKGDNNNIHENVSSDKVLCEVEWLIRQIN